MGQALTITGVTVLDGLGGEPSPGPVHVVDGRVSGVGPVAAVPAGAALLEVAGGCVVPGLIDAISIPMAPIST